MKFSNYAEHYSSQSGIVQLMEDLSITTPPGQATFPLGGGNPAHIREVQDALRESAQALTDSRSRFASMIGDYDAPQGHEKFRCVLAAELSTLFGRPIGAENIAITNGSQASFEILFNSLAGQFDDGSWREIALPIAPEYVGYNDMSRQSRSILRASPAQIDLLADQQFKYRIDTSAFSVNSASTGAVCLSRPTNPSGNVISDEELARVAGQCRDAGVPLIIDSAYGLPFPGMIYTEATPFWDENTILCLSLSKLGLPGVRTGIVVADTAVTQLIRNANAINGLAPARTGPELLLPLIERRQLSDLCERVIKPHYLAKQQRAIDTMLTAAHDLPVRIHKPDGAMFLWTWFEDLPGGTDELYRRGVAEGIITVPGRHFFQGLESSWQHARECLRINYAGEPDVVCEGIERLVNIARRQYRGAS
ncbi:valine--pyruvate transaminase [Luminiphilus sp.]|nr:valine--pyruvate transaminase [Luminiphilus sp.]